MATDDVLLLLRTEMEEELRVRILPFWMEQAADRRRGGVVGLISDAGERNEDAPKGAVLHARVLWTFSAAFRALGDPRYRARADSVAAYLTSRFVDPVHHGVFWMIGADGQPLDTRKHVYAQAFAIYGLAEHFRATGEASSLGTAVALFRLVEKHAHDAKHGGYEEAFSREWVLLDDVRLSDQDANERKSMNSHLHLLEAYTALYTVWPDALLRSRIEELVTLFEDTIVGRDGAHVVRFFSADWQPHSSGRSFGHDIEASWLLLEASGALGDGVLCERARATSLRIASSVLADGYDAADGGVYNERAADNHLDTDKEWWQQAEAIVGFLGAYQESGRVEFLEAAVNTWTFVKKHVRDERNGEWHRRVSKTGVIRPAFEKVGPWKCPYHNARACLEVASRVDEILARAAILQSGAAPSAAARCS
jgi:mannobiose 2-epimerase